MIPEKPDTDTLFKLHERDHKKPRFPNAPQFLFRV